MGRPWQISSTNSLFYRVKDQNGKMRRQFVEGSRPLSLSSGFTSGERPFGLPLRFQTGI